jgi:hypothetical protein
MHDGRRHLQRRKRACIDAMPELVQGEGDAKREAVGAGGAWLVQAILVGVLRKKASA